MIELIEKKKQGRRLSQRELQAFITGLVAGEIPDYQTSALLMAVWFRGMEPEETFDLTMAMRDSGAVFDLSAVGPTIDKHSTGGIGDKLSLIALPLWAACGLGVVKLSGRGLGFTGGTIDKLESVPNVSTSLTAAEFMARARRDRFVISGQSDELVPADKILYALRDVTATVDSLPLIAASIMSKKLAVKADTLVLDVKFGRGALMKSYADAQRLAGQMIDIGQRAGQRVAAMFSPMDQPLGRAVGNGLEVAEAVEVLQGGGCADLREEALTLAVLGLYLQNGGDRQDARRRIGNALQSGAGLQSLIGLLEHAGAQIPQGDLLSVLPRSQHQFALTAEADGYVRDVDALQIGEASVLLGAGRRQKGDEIDPAAGIVLCCQWGDFVRRGETLAVLHGRGDLSQHGPAVRRAFTLGPEPPAAGSRAVCRCLIDVQTVLPSWLLS